MLSGTEWTVGLPCAGLGHGLHDPWRSLPAQDILWILHSRILHLHLALDDFCKPDL